MSNRIDLIQTDCQEVHYCYDFVTCLRHAFIDKDNHPVEAVESAVRFDPLETFYWVEELEDPDLRREDLRLDAEVVENGHVLMEVHPNLFRHPEVIDLESVYFGVGAQGWEAGDVIRMKEIGFIWVMAFLKGDLLPRIRDGRLMIYEPKELRDGEPEDREKKAVATAAKKGAKIRRLNVPPHDVVKEGKRLELWACWLPMYRQMYRRSRFGMLRSMPHYPRETTRKGRYYFLGVAYLARITGLDEWTVRQVLHRLEDAKLIYIRYKGYKGRGCSIIEIPCNLKLVWKWRREHQVRKVST